jgi:DNA-binding IscR family transcriptional regulator
VIESIGRDKGHLIQTLCVLYRLVDKQGFVAITTNEIAEYQGVSPRSIQSNFKELSHRGYVLREEKWRPKRGVTRGFKLRYMPDGTMNW